MTSKTKTSQILIILSLLIAGLTAAEPAAAASGAQATFIGTDTTTQGNWQGLYGNDGYSIADTTTNKVPGYVAFTPQNQANWIWTADGAETRDLEVPSSVAANMRQASCWYTSSGNSYSLDVNISDGHTHQIALYALDWDQQGRAETIQAVDGVSGTVLDTRNLSNFSNGVYDVWNVSGNVKFNITVTGGINAVISGAFFDPANTNVAKGSAQFVATDTSTQGNWHGVYGADGYTVVGGGQVTPSYATATPENQFNWTWAASTTDPRAPLQTSTSSARVAATWYNVPTFSVDVSVTDGKTHQFALYAVDWDERGRAETIQVVDAQTKAVLNSQSIFGFTNGVYVVWNISGHVTVTVTNTGGVNGVVSGAFFGGNTASAPATVTVTPPTGGGTTTTTGGTLPSGLVLHWTFDTANISGATVTDTSNSGGTGTMYGNPSTVSGKFNQALAFNGVNSYLSMYAYADTATEFNNSVTLAAWIKTTNSTRTEGIISKFTAAGSAAGYIFQTDAAGNVGLRVGAEDLYAYPAVVSDITKINDGNWHHVAVVITMGTGAQFYVDGQLSSTAAMQVFAGGDGGSNLEVATSGYTPWANYFTGSIDDVQVYNRALSTTEIGTVYSYGGGIASQSGTTQTPPTQTAPSPGYLTVSPASFNFGSVNVGSNVTQKFTVSNSGASTVTFSNATVAGAGLTASGVSSGTTLLSGQSITLTVTYAPASAVALSGDGVTFTSNASDSSVLLSLTGTGVQPPPGTHNAATFLGTDTTTQGAWKGIGNFNAPPASSSLVYGKDGVILPDTEGCDTSCNPFPSYVSFGPQLVNSSTPGNLGSKPYSTHAYVDMVQGPTDVMGAEPQNTSNNDYFQCNYTFSNPAAPWAPMVAWRPTTDTREISNWYTCSSIPSFYLEFSFGSSTHNFEIYVVDDQNGGGQLRSEEIQVLDGDTDVVLYDSGSFTNFTGGVYYRWSITGHVKVKVINTSTNGTWAVINGAFFN
jgi:Concanavalin A-like lectin/glucanases superfamily/Abnormal spindle-like microcephaly-assoc'd, ASPM-SPD-2-Hydin